MTPPRPAHTLYRETQSDWVRLRTLILLRWLAIAGQLAAMAVAASQFNVILPLNLCLFVVGTAVAANLAAMFLFPQNKRLTEGQALITLLFDLSQLAFLLFLTGGISNPFALLIIAPVAVAAAALEVRTTLVLGATAVALVSLVSLVNLPLVTRAGIVLSIPQVFAFGFWLSIVTAIVFIGIYAQSVASEVRSMSQALLATQMALSREQKLTDLGGVVAAAAHELGTPLATITLVSTELIDDAAGQDDLLDDLRLIRDQADRCRDILRSMGRAGKDDLHLRSAPLGAVVREAAEPHMERGKTIAFSARPLPGADARQPTIRRMPEIIHGLRNLVQNAVDFAHTAVWVDIEWADGTINVRIADDGPGFPSHLIGRIGDPFMRSRSGAGATAERPGYEGMGLGLFIAKTLLERTGAVLTFANGSDPFLTEDERPERSGATITVRWPPEAITADASQPLGANLPISG
ncbi:MAG: ActS/PrrB/RegB family redox-sensitive histidine kinase [Paracoccaceae bacterium]